jgi:hypothetical protein
MYRFFRSWAFQNSHKLFFWCEKMPTIWQPRPNTYHVVFLRTYLFIRSQWALLLLLQSIPFARVARFFSVQTYQNGKNIPSDHKLYQIAIKYTTWPKTVPSGHKIFQHFPFQRTSQMYPIWDFWYENEPSGSPAFRRVIGRERGWHADWTLSLFIEIDKEDKILVSRKRKIR